MPAWTGTLKDFELLNTFRFAAAAVSSGALTIPARELLLCLINVTGYSGSDIVSLRFNADATTTNYRTRWITFSNVAVPINAGIDFGASGHVVLGSTGITTGRSILCSISNFATTRKIVSILHAYEEAAQATIPLMQIGQGEWFNTAAQITSIDMRTNGGVNTLSIGSSIAIYGLNP